MSLNEVQVCVECGKADNPNATVCDGEKLLELTERIVEAELFKPHLKVRPVACLGNCDHSCRLAIASLDKWSWSIGDINPSIDETFLRAFLEKWICTQTGLIPKHQRSQALLDKALGRQPPLMS